MTRRKRRRQVVDVRLPELSTRTVATLVCTGGMIVAWLLGFGWVALLFGVLGAFNISTAPRRPRPGRVEAATRKLRAPRERPYRTRAQRRRAKQAAILRGKVRSGRARISRDVRCSWRCRASRAPRRWCRCECGGRSHGELRGHRRALRV